MQVYIFTNTIGKIVQLDSDRVTEFRKFSFDSHEISQFLPRASLYQGHVTPSERAIYVKHSNKVIRRNVGAQDT